uniref:Uncharacterized protein n=1 Tax=Oryza glumipatula TaxID=40148 RepID=A0A0E0BLB0_9ORYZ
MAAGCGLPEEEMAAARPRSICVYDVPEFTARSVDCGSCMPDIHIQAKLSARGFFLGSYILIDLTVLTSEE